MSKIQDIQTVLLDILDKTIEVFDKYNLQWFADSGTLLGAIREGKMIDWDDDIDIIMPRQDYNKFLEVGPNEFSYPYFFQTPLTDSMWSQHPRIRKSGTTGMTELDVGGKHHMGLFIDIFCLDSLPDNDEYAQNLKGFMMTLTRHSSISEYGDRFIQSKFNIKDAFNVMNTVVTEMTNENTQSKYVANVLLFRSRRCQNVKLLRGSYNYSFDIDFQGLKHKMKIPVGYEHILLQWYGDTWKTPIKGGSFHETNLFNPYRDYSVFYKLSKDDWLEFVKLKDY